MANRVLTSLTTPFRTTSGTARWLLVTGLVITTLFVVVAVFAPWIAPTDFSQNKVDGARIPKLQGPSGAHPFGTNDQFYDVLSRVIWGARTGLEVSDIRLDRPDRCLLRDVEARILQIRASVAQRESPHLDRVA